MEALDLANTSWVASCEHRLSSDTNPSQDENKDNVLAAMLLHSYHCIHSFAIPHLPQLLTTTDQ